MSGIDEKLGRFNYAPGDQDSHTMIEAGLNVDEKRKFGSYTVAVLQRNAPNKPALNVEDDEDVIFVGESFRGPGHSRRKIEDFKIRMKLGEPPSNIVPQCGYPSEGVPRGDVGRGPCFGYDFNSGRNSNSDISKYGEACTTPRSRPHIRLVFNNGLARANGRPSLVNTGEKTVSEVSNQAQNLETPVYPCDEGNPSTSHKGRGISPKSDNLGKHLTTDSRKEATVEQLIPPGTQDLQLSKSSKNCPRIPDKRFECKECHKRFHANHEMKAHFRCHTKEKPYLCRVCSKSFAQLGDLKIHLRTHTGERPYSCKICNMRFIQRGHLKDHLRVHTNERPFSCEVCGKRYIQKGELRNHMRSHTNERPYTCHECNKQFFRNSTLKNHLRIHAGFKCPECGQKFSQSSHLTSHMDTHVIEKQFACCMCDMKFKLEKHLKIHKTRSHSQTQVNQCPPHAASESSRKSILPSAIQSDQSTPHTTNNPVQTFWIPFGFQINPGPPTTTQLLRTCMRKSEGFLISELQTFLG